MIRPQNSWSDIEPKRVALSQIVGAPLVLLGGVAVLGCWLLGVGVVVKADESEVLQLIRGHLGLALGVLLVLVAGGALLLRSHAEVGRIRAALGEREAELQRVQIMAKLAHVITAPDGSFERWPDTLPQLMGLQAGRMPRSVRGLLHLLHPDDREKFRTRNIEAAVKGTRVDVEYRLLGPSGAWIHVHQISEPFGDEPAAGGKHRWLSTLQDITELKSSREQRSRQQDQLIAMSRRLVTLQEKERRDIARELHDRVGQNLSMLSINLERLRASSAGRESAARIADCVSVVEAMGLVIQDVLTELKPPMLANYGLIDAVRFHAREFTRRTGIAVEVTDTHPAQRLSPDVEMALFRIAQGALNNVAQHTRAKNAQISLEREDDRMTFRIRDDGAGFDAAQAMASGSWGLTAMRERAEAIDGELRIESAPGRGSCVIVELGAAQ